MRISALVFGLFVATAANAQTYTLAGDTIDAAIVRTVDSGYGLGRIYGYGLDAPFIAAEGTADQRQYSSAFTINVDGGAFDIRFLNSAGWQDGIVLRLSDLNFSPIGTSFLSGLTVDTNLVGYGLTIRPDSIDLALGGTHFDSSTYFAGKFNVSAVPEPSSLALLTLGLIGIASTTRRTRCSQPRTV